jgi:hypothetical protein
MSHSPYQDRSYHSFPDSKPTSSYDKYYRSVAATPPRRPTRIIEPAELAVRRYDPTDVNMPSWFSHTRKKESTTYAAHAAHTSMWQDVQGRRGQEIGWASKQCVNDGGYAASVQYVNDSGYGVREQYKVGQGVEEEEQTWWYGSRDHWVGEKAKERPLFRKEKMYIVRRR